MSIATNESTPLLPPSKQVSWTGDTIVRLSLHKPALLITRFDIVPFSILYAICVFYIRLYNISWFFTQMILVSCAILHILAFLIQHWSVKAKAFMSWSQVYEIRPETVIDSSIHVLLQPGEHRGKTELIPVQVDNHDNRIYFIFQKRTYEYDEQKNSFVKVAYPTDLPLSHYLDTARATGGLNNEIVQTSLRRFDKNILDMPSPTFLELYVESLLAPFFIFQLFCIMLWFLDEYWKTSLATLVMMLIFEATVVSGRLRSLREIRGMRNAAQKVHVFRNKKWETILSPDLLPGDIISIGRGRDPSHIIPCDLLILSGSVVVNEAMLTGESVPLMKEGISVIDDSEREQPLSLKVHKNHVLYGGTRILTHTPATVSAATPATKAPDNGCVCYILRTGFGSSQGRLMRTILYSTESVSANSAEAAFFILFLLMFAIAASSYVLYHLYTEDQENRYKLLLRCVLIITSVVPPELPMQLALAVNTSLISLVRNMIFCTEPYRIPYAGKIDVCCFDKTGTLTTDSINAVGVSLPPNSIADSESTDYTMVPVAKATTDASLVLGACHSLVHVDNELIGDPLELAALEAVQWNYGRTGTCVPKRGGMSAAYGKILHRFPFSSALQRMSVVAEVGGDQTKSGMRVLVKGSPEAIGNLLSKEAIPEKYKENSRRLARSGMRVLAMAYKDLGSGLTASEASRISREEAESDLIFAGFVCFECPLRSDSRKVIRALKKANHYVSMITGDAVLTAADVATQVGMCTKSVLILDKSEINPGTFEWFSANSGTRKKRFAVNTIEQLGKDFDLCVGGPALRDATAQNPSMRKQLKHIKVFARMSPDQKEGILTALKEAGLITMMCGDGTNDVGALKQSHVGVALLSPPAKNPSIVDNIQADISARSQVINDDGAATRSEKGSSIRQRKKSTSNKASRSKTAKEKQKELLDKKMEELSEAMSQADDQPPLVKLGDASIASPFTSRRMTIDSCLSIIRQGRCTLATTLQMYQILALNCLISAYSLSVLHVQGVMISDKQMTISIMVLSVASFTVSRSKPLKKLSPQRPAHSVFAPALFLSLMGQFAVHLLALVASMHIVQPFLPPNFTPVVADEFSPSLLNSIVFLLSIAQQLSVYVLNYKGRPFMEGLRDNKMLMNVLILAAVILAVFTMEIFPAFNEAAELVPWPTPKVQRQVAGVIIFDLIGSFLADRIFTFIFSPRIKTIQ